MGNVRLLQKQAEMRQRNAAVGIAAPSINASEEKFYTVQEIAAKLRRSDDWVRAAFSEQPGTVITGRTASTRIGHGYKRRYRTMIIPEQTFQTFILQHQV